MKVKVKRSGPAPVTFADLKYGECFRLSTKNTESNCIHMKVCLNVDGDNAVSLNSGSVFSMSPFVDVVRANVEAVEL